MHYFLIKRDRTLVNGVDKASLTKALGGKKDNANVITWENSRERGHYDFYTVTIYLLAYEDKSLDVSTEGRFYVCTSNIKRNQILELPDAFLKRIRFCIEADSNDFLTNEEMACVYKIWKSYSRISCSSEKVEEVLKAKESNRLEALRKLDSLFKTRQVL